MCKIKMFAKGFSVGLYTYARTKNDHNICLHNELHILRDAKG